MSIKKIDAKGLACPMPVIKTKKALEEISEGVVEVTVDDNAPKENILKFAKSVNCEAELIKDEADEKIIRIVKGEGTAIDAKAEDFSCDIASTGNEVVAIMSNRLGSGNDELGEVLIKSFLFALNEATPLPKSVLFLNGGVELTTINEATVENIKRLEDAGVEILSCGTCLDYYGLKEELKVGSLTNMYTIVETMKSASKVITIG
ncbi:SirA family protein [Peptostreptococcus russellii]|uniref:SirA family protein n=1 Tax=Peptostreptococcus russellii TaxID=215200 RepID=A0A2P7PZB2_9FIRM|nr:sulfurtransferase-like selenium metabolism protein YedF [Peptostreptococcus russellii]PSJ31067.1 SirA family protein [Peptostreptococcus russellii]